MSPLFDLMNYRDATSHLFKRAQELLCAAIETYEPSARFKVDTWDRDNKGGGGESRVLNGDVFEQAGVNFSRVFGKLSKEATHKLIGQEIEAPFFATGVSVVIHPRSPMIPTTHCNYRYLEVGEQSWFGGGADLTPYYLFEEDAKHFHQTLKNKCDLVDKEFYPKYKKWCDEYFYLPHRGETRGIGGIFFDYLGQKKEIAVEKAYSLAEKLSHSMAEPYTPIVTRRLLEPYGENERDFQLVRRGRYVEFNLLYDRGTHFGLKTGGRTESILMSLPPEVRWRYAYTPEAGSPEAKLLTVLKSPIAWV